MGSFERTETGRAVPIDGVKLLERPRMREEEAKFMSQEGRVFLGAGSGKISVLLSGLAGCR
jgi:hypothetical protein